MFPEGVGGRGQCCVPGDGGAEAAPSPVPDTAEGWWSSCSCTTGYPQHGEAGDSPEHHRQYVKLLLGESDKLQMDQIVRVVEI